MNNPICQCPAAGWCDRHQMKKTGVEYGYCNGGDVRYWNGWEAGRLGATKPADPQPDPDGFGDPVPDVSSIGTALHQIITRETGQAIPCAECQRQIDRLNTLTTAQATAQAATLAADIVKRAGQIAPHLWQRVAARVLPTLTGSIVAGWIAEAIETGAQPAAEPAKKKRHIVRKGNRHVVHRGEPLPPMPFRGAPRLSLVFHSWPRLGWRRHLAQLRAVEHRFTHKLLGIATGPGTEPAESVRAEFPGWIVYEYPNDPSRAESITLNWARSILQSDHDDVAFYCHAKGTKDSTRDSEAVKWWTEAMYATVIHNIDDVCQRMAGGAAFVGSFRYLGGFLPSRHRWHYSGTFYALRSAVVLPLNRAVSGRYFGSEAWPGDCVPAAQSSNVFAEMDWPKLYHVDQQPRAALDRWKDSQTAATLPKIDTHKLRGET